MTRALRVAAWVVCAVSAVSLGVGTGLSARTFDAVALGLAWPLPNILVGGVLTLRRARLLTGWLFAGIGFLGGTGALADVAAAAGGGMSQPPWWSVAGAWYGEWYWIPMLYLTLAFVPLLFPNGVPPSPRWNRLVSAMVATLSLLVVLAMLQERLDAPSGLSVRNPIGIPGLPDVEEGLGAVFFLGSSMVYLVLAMVSLVVRFRRSLGVERQQLKWFTSGAAVLIVGFVLQGVGDALFARRAAILDIGLFALTPVAAAAAILRYRLYAIDRIISRTVTYGLVTALLAGVYVGGVAVMSALADPIADSSISVAAATLAAAAVFRPARRRIQGSVDRRFNRARYDVDRTLEGFRERVRNDVDLERLCDDLVAITDQALQPRAATVWLRAPEGQT